MPYVTIQERALGRNSQAIEEDWNRPAGQVLVKTWIEQTLKKGYNSIKEAVI